MTSKTELIKEIKKMCPVELNTAEMKVLNVEQLEEFKQDLENSLNPNSLTKPYPHKEKGE